MDYITIGISVITLICTLVTVWIGLRKQQRESAKAAADAAAREARAEEKITELTREVRMHNDFARRIPVVENNIETLYRRLGKLEEKQ